MRHSIPHIAHGARTAGLSLFGLLFACEPSASLRSRVENRFSTVQATPSPVPGQQPVRVVLKATAEPRKTPEPSQSTLEAISKPLRRGAGGRRVRETEAHKASDNEGSGVLKWLPGQVLRFNGTLATIDLGADVGMKEGMQGYIQRQSGVPLPFVIRKVLQYSSAVEVHAELSEADLGAHALVVQKQATRSTRADETRKHTE